MESTNIILVYCPPLRGLIRYNIGYFACLLLLPPIAGIDNFNVYRLAEGVGYCPPLRGLILDVPEVGVFEISITPHCGD